MANRTKMKAGDFTAAQAALIAQLKAHIESPLDSNTTFARRLSNYQLAMQLPVQLVPGLAALPKEDIFMQPVHEDCRATATLKPGRQLMRFFEIIGVNPADVLTQTTLSMSAAPRELLGGKEAKRLNREAIAIMRGYMDMLEADYSPVAKGEPLLFFGEVEEILQYAKHGGYPAFMGMTSVAEVLQLQSRGTYRIEGTFGVGICTTDDTVCSHYGGRGEWKSIVLTLAPGDFRIPRIDNTTVIPASVSESILTISQEGPST